MTTSSGGRDGDTSAATPATVGRADATVGDAATRVDEFSIDDDLAGERLDVAVAALTGQSRSRAATAIDDGRVVVAGARRPRSHRLELGQVVAVTAVASVAPSPPPPLPPIVVDDPGFWILDKPAGMVVHPGHGHPDGTLADAVRAAGVVDVGPDPIRPGIVHRLDKDTSGLLLVARTATMHEALVGAMRDRDVTRAYLTLVQGTCPARTGPSTCRWVVTIATARASPPVDRRPRRRDPLPRGRDRARSPVRHQAAPRAPVSLVACRLETGRTHQIRVHMAHVGAPVVGDLDYGASPDLAAAPWPRAHVPARRTTGAGAPRHGGGR